MIEGLGRHPRWTFNFTPTSASWRNADEGFLAVFTECRLKLGVSMGVIDLEAAIHRFGGDRKLHLKPFVRTADLVELSAATRAAKRSIQLAGFIWGERLTDVKRVGGVIFYCS